MSAVEETPPAVEETKRRTRRKPEERTQRSYVILKASEGTEDVQWNVVGQQAGTSQRRAIQESADVYGVGTYKAVNMRAWEATYDVTQEVRPVTTVTLVGGEEGEENDE